MTDYIKLGMMAAEFADACKAIRRRADEARTANIRQAWTYLLDGDIDGRDRLCDKAKDVDEVASRAIMEAWLRIGEKYGIERDEAMQMFEKVRRLN